MPNDVPAWQNTSDNGVIYQDDIYDSSGNFIGVPPSFGGGGPGGISSQSSSGLFGVIDGGINTGGASGGFVLYPSKANTNMMNRVYSK